MKILHTADWHIGPQQGPMENGVNVRYMDTLNCIRHMVNKAWEEIPNIVCISGDILDKELVAPSRYTDEVLTATDFIVELASIAEHVIVMRGTPNHDGAGQYRMLAELLAPYKNVEVVMEPQVIHTAYADIACIPGFEKQEFRAKFPDVKVEDENLIWTEHISTITMGLRAMCGKDKPAILMAHYTVPGANAESGQTAFFANFEPVIPQEALLAADFDGVFLGHIHRPQEIEGLRNVFYSGAINALNFNDEGQERGFFIHDFKELDGRWVLGSRFITTPYRQFQTIKWSTEDVEEYLQTGELFLQANNYPELIDGKIVRVKYDCTEKQKKALNTHLLRKSLTDMGAFMVTDVLEETVFDVVNKGLLSEESDPLANLKKYLDEKCIKDADAITELAEPIISKALSQNGEALYNGVFRPVSIRVKNYRNYKEASFDFSDVTFCTINGTNGAGKSSLFMDAIIDCLFEEPREGKKVGWIRASDDAKSGDIEFIFDIGEKRFRILRSRAKYGAPKLNISQLAENGTDWINVSKETMDQTEEEIKKIVGMDSMTFKSCALIMQDQYGLFLQANKTDRMAILGNLLGLKLYEEMKKEAEAKFTAFKREVASGNTKIEVKSNQIKSKGDPEQELDELENRIEKTEKDIMVCIEQEATARTEHAAYEKLKSEYWELTEKRGDLCRKKNEIANKKQEAEIELGIYKKFLENEAVIVSAVAEHTRLTEMLPELSKKQAQYEEALKQLEAFRTKTAKTEQEITLLKEKISEIDEKIAYYQNLYPADLEERYGMLLSLRALLGEQRRKKELYFEHREKTSDKRREILEEYQHWTNKEDQEKLRVYACEEQQRFLNQSGCIDVGNARCEFLKKAKEMVLTTESHRELYEMAKSNAAQCKARYEQLDASLSVEIEQIGYDPHEEERLISEIYALEKYELMKKQNDENKLQIARLEAEKESSHKFLREYEQTLSTLILDIQRATETVDGLSGIQGEYENVRNRCAELAPYVEKEKQIPVFRTKMQFIEESILSYEKEWKELDEQCEECQKSMFAVKALSDTFTFTVNEKPEVLRTRIDALQGELMDMQVKKGGIIQRAEDVKALEADVKVLRAQVKENSKLQSYYETLKQAFSQDGVPHQIIRNFIPHITGVANSILGSMTGGTMGIEFSLEKEASKKGGGEKPALDVLIHEYGKNVMPYVSKSGGEKVKASLAVILALAEVKASYAGIQLGMLFIDEAPFLDADGTNAYCDALETIRERYPDTIVMAITHDPEFKSRFPQAVTIVKDEDGSHVQWG